MTHSHYLTLLKIFLIVMPIELAIVGAFAWACVQNNKTNQPAFWYALMCIGVLVPEIIRAIIILHGDIPPQCKDISLWVAELFPFGGFLYDLIKRHFFKVWTNFRND